MKTRYFKLSIIYLKEKRKTGRKVERKVRMLGVDTWLSEKDFKKQVVNGLVSLKVNKPYTEKDMLAEG
mgnify:CR=1 FL=1|jgi:hypothetical protein